MSDQLPHRPNPNTMQPATPTDQDRIQALTKELAGKDKIIEDLEAMKQAYAKIITLLQHAAVQRDEVIEQAAGIQTLLESHIETLKEKIASEVEISGHLRDRVKVLDEGMQVQEKRIELLRKTVQAQNERIELLSKTVQAQKEGIEEADGVIEMLGEKIATLEERDRVLKGTEAAFGVNLRAIEPMVGRLSRTVPVPDASGYPGSP
ncbi:hypothetical protein LTR10_004508 [Elasticomyces elasticus]|nr:hypothetical protein LTR10_004508 [Elasticomyces elasticus]KAK4976827.1 hypothetical protein LTR42_002872 [Elasticomyces elasticus]